ncbi:polyprenyl synthetase family protein [Engelhardtia mirabilis]|uniref:Heptaprenyl diphosphate synthase component 2 n=1 Tax=Engelhardtia mirabilis TaxID=2528011 RepID=A0A518BJN6_9BACT|nr:Heptaprenyl diphosphate synthase component 2 [Planctomycetes bacterium Pla133]QDV01509.1 Heptaprenyl diphosphate synthase component 2 [Planctomycetes bacterium Pla86]
MSDPSGELPNLLAPIEADLERTREVLDRELSDNSPAVRDMLDHISRFRGKQLRAAMVLLCGRASGAWGPEHPQVAAVVEMIHLATLVHDDVLDGASVRRRVASVNTRWDNQVAVLLGDWLYARAFALSTRLQSPLVSRHLALTTQKICKGEIEQAGHRYDFDLSRDGYEAIAGAKTASLYAAACELGALYPDGDERTASELGLFGWEVGLAFQIVDDVLDLTGTQEEVGKPVGNDVDDGKVTLPVLHVYASADNSQRAAIRDAYTEPGLADRVGRLREVCDLRPGLEAARGRADELLRTALGRLSVLPDGPIRETLARAGSFVLQRRY